MDREDSERPSDPAGWAALTAELVRSINAATGGQAREDDPRSQQALVMRLTGSGLAPTDAGGATVAEVRETVADTCKRWEPGMVSLVAICGPKFWDHHGRVGTPMPQKGRGKDKPHDPTFGGIVEDPEEWLREWSKPMPPKAPAVAQVKP